MGSTEPTRSRRVVLRSALGVVAGVLAGWLGRPNDSRAADNDPLILGSNSNTASNPTMLGVGGNQPNVVLAVSADITTGGTTAILGTAASGPGVRGIAFEDITGSAGIEGYGPTGVMGSVGSARSPNTPGSARRAGVYGVGGQTQFSGVIGEAFAEPAVVGLNHNADGVAGITDYGRGVSGSSLYRTGVFGRAGTGLVDPRESIGLAGVRGWDATLDSASRGVHGYSTRGTGVAAEAASTGVALSVIGKAVFSRSGRVAITAGHSSVSKTLAGVSTASLVIATPQTNRAGVYVQAVVPASGKFTVYLNKTVSATTYVAFMVLN